MANFYIQCTGTEMMNFRPHPSRSVHGAGGPRASRSKSNWRQRHTELVEAMSNARATKRAMAAGLPLPPPPPPSANPDYVQCPYCMRRFNETAAERHIPICKVKLHQSSSIRVRQNRILS